MLGHASIGDQSVDCTLLGHNGVDGVGDRDLFCDIALHEVQAIGVALLEGLEFWTRLEQVEGIDD